MVIQAMYILSNNSAGEPVKLGQFKLPLSDICHTVSQIAPASPPKYSEKMGFRKWLKWDSSE